MDLITKSVKIDSGGLLGSIVANGVELKFFRRQGGFINKKN
jgi:hypothetical protein